MSDIVDVEAAAFVYLMAETESICKHDQDSWFHEAKDCGTSACLAGHAGMYEHGEKGGRRISMAHNSAAEGARIIMKPEKLFYSLDEMQAMKQEKRDHAMRVKNALNELADIFKLTSGTIQVRGIKPITDDPITGDMKAEEMALSEFKAWVYTYTSDEEQKQFENLISVNPKKLKKSKLSDKNPA
jgi:hypothetical protein